MEENQKVWFASDHHFGHEFLKRLRGFETVEIMDQTIIDAHNSVVKRGDDVYFLGDFLFKSNRHIEYYTEQLNGNLHLVRGNHDKISLEGKTRGFSWVKDYYEGKFPNVLSESWKSDPQILVVMSHYPMLAWHKNSRGSLMLHGHVHANLRSTEVTRGRTKDVLICETNEWKPFELQDILKELGNRPIVAPDCENY